MSDTPTYANLLTRLFSGGTDERASALAALEVVSDADRMAVEPEVRSRLRDSFPWMRLIAAEVVLRIYRDVDVAADAVATVIRDGEPSVVADVAVLLRQFGPRAIPLLVLVVRHAPDVFATQTTDFHTWAAEIAIRGGPDGLNAFLEMLGVTGYITPLLLGLAQTAPTVSHDLSRLEPALRAKLAEPRFQVAAGIALWRVTWRVNRAWLASIQPEIGSGVSDVRGLLLEVLIEHLGRRSDIAELVRKTLLSLAETDAQLAGVAVRRLSSLGSLGWGVLIPMLNERGHADFRGTILAHSLGLPRVLSLIHHHAHAAILTDEPNTAPSILGVVALSQLGPVAGTAIPDLLNLAARASSMASTVREAIPKLAAGFPNTPAAIVRTLQRVRTTGFFNEDQHLIFRELATALGELAPDIAVRLIDNTEVDPRVIDLLLQQPAWKDARPEARIQHVRILADGLANQRPEVRIRAAEAMRHYRPELPAVWPALVAVLAGSDEKVAFVVLPQFRCLEAVADIVTPDLVTLFREPKPDYAARAVVALWRLGRLDTVGFDLRRAVEADPSDGWGWAVLRGVVARVSLSHGLLAELKELFAAAPGAIAEQVAALVTPPESPEDQQFSLLLPRPEEPTGRTTVDWDGIVALLTSDAASDAMFTLALMCEYGSAGLSHRKIWLIKHHRALTRMGLAESKLAVERVLEILPQPGASSTDRQRAVRGYFSNRYDLPSEIVAMLDHRLGWFRWAGLELADAWGLSVEQVKTLTEDRVWDTNPRVRERALRMARG